MRTQGKQAKDTMREPKNAKMESKISKGQVPKGAQSHQSGAGRPPKRRQGASKNTLCGARAKSAEKGAEKYGHWCVRGAEIEPKTR